MIDVTQDIHSLTAFKRNSSGLMKHMKKTGRPLVLTVNGKAEAVVLDAKAYQEVASQLDAVANIRRGLAQARKGAGRAADEVFYELGTSRYLTPTPMIELSQQPSAAAPIS
jgi:prevent-host-death family protein